MGRASYYKTPNQAIGFPSTLAHISLQLEEVTQNTRPSFEGRYQPSISELAEQETQQLGMWKLYGD
jgi:hypothetical protein